MDSALFQRIAEELFPTVELVDLRGWGESLILPNIIELIRHTHSFGCDIRFVTNLSFSRETVLEALAEHHCYLAVSIDSAEYDILPKLRGNASLAKIKSNLVTLVKLYRAIHGSAERITLFCTVQRPALKTLESLVFFAAEVGVSEIRLAKVTAPKKPHLSLCGQDEAVIAALESVQNAARRNGIKVLVATHFAGLPENQHGIPSCIHPWTYAYINVRGEVGFCDHLIGPFARKLLMGDLNNTCFNKIWNSSRWQDLRREHLGPRRAEAPLFAHCDWCYRNRFVEFEDLFFSELAGSKIMLSSY